MRLLTEGLQVRVLPEEPFLFRPKFHDSLVNGIASRLFNRRSRVFRNSDKQWRRLLSPNVLLGEFSGICLNAVGALSGSHSPALRAALGLVYSARPTWVAERYSFPK
jgi:hypothetical protein